jgi:hypothetical protein
LQRLAHEFEDRIIRGRTGNSIINYNIGARLAAVIKDPKYGDHAVENLAEYLNIDGGAQKLYAVITFAKEFAGTEGVKFIERWSSMPMKNGGSLTLTHWINLLQLKTRELQEQYLEQTIEKSWTSDDLLHEIRASNDGKKHARQGGRKPKRPTSAVAGLQKFFSLSQQAYKYEEIIEKDSFDVIVEMPPEDISESMQTNLQKVIDIWTKLRKAAPKVLERASACMTRVEKVLTRKKAGDAEEGEEHPHKAKAKASASSNGNGKMKAKKKLKKKIQA